MLAGEIDALKTSLKWKTSQPENLDCTPRLLDPSLDLAGLPISRSRKRFKLFRQGELSQLARDAMRRASEPVKLREIATAQMAKGSYDETARAAQEKRVRANLAHLSRGALAKAPDDLIAR